MDWLKRFPEPLRSVAVLAVVLGFWAALLGGLYVSKLIVGGVATLVLLGVLLTWFLTTHQD